MKLEGTNQTNRSISFPENFISVDWRKAKQFCWGFVQYHIPSLNSHWRSVLQGIVQVNWVSLCQKSTGLALQMNCLFKGNTNLTNLILTTVPWSRHLDFKQWATSMGRGGFGEMSSVDKAWGNWRYRLRWICISLPTTQKTIEQMSQKSQLVTSLQIAFWDQMTFWGSFVEKR